MDALNDGRAYMAAKKLLDAGAVIDIAQVDRPDFNPMDLLKS